MSVTTVPPAARFAGIATILCSVLALLPCGRLLHAADAISPLAGTWTLEAADNLDREGHQTPAFGAHPQGVLIVDAQGRYSLQIFRSNQPATVMGHEVFKAAQLVSSHFGHISVDRQRHLLTFDISMAYSSGWNASGNYSPNWNGTEQVRSYTLSREELSYRVPPEPGSSYTPISVWRRIAPAS